MQDRRALPVVLALLGLALTVGGLISWSWAADAERVTDLVRDELSDDGLERHRDDLETATALFDDFVGVVLPALAADLGVPPDQLIAEVRTASPELDRFLTEQADLFAFADRSLTNLENQQSRFERADRLPAAGLPITAGPLAAVALGLVVTVAAATVGLARRRSPAIAALIVALVAGLAVSIGTVAAGAPGRAADAREVMDSLDPSPAAVARTRAALDTASDAGKALTEDVLPAVAERLDESSLGLSLRLATQFPEVALGVTAIPGIVDRYEDRTQIRVDAASPLRQLNGLPLTAMVWGAVALGLAIALTAGAGLVARQRGRASVDHSIG